MPMKAWADCSKIAARKQWSGPQGGMGASRRILSGHPVRQFVPDAASTNQVAGTLSGRWLIVHDQHSTLTGLSWGLSLASGGYPEATHETGVKSGTYFAISHGVYAVKSLRSKVCIRPRQFNLQEVRGDSRLASFSIPSRKIALGTQLEILWGLVWLKGFVSTRTKSDQCLIYICDRNKTAGCKRARERERAHILQKSKKVQRSRSNATCFGHHRREDTGERKHFCRIMML